jgi:hypothetical protein
MKGMMTIHCDGRVSERNVAEANGTHDEAQRIGKGVKPSLLASGDRGGADARGRQRGDERGVLGGDTTDVGGEGSAGHAISLAGGKDVSRQLRSDLRLEDGVLSVVSAGQPNFLKKDARR